MKYFLGSEGHGRPIDEITHLNIPQSLNGKIWCPSWRDCLDILVCKLELSLNLSSVYTLNGIWYPFYSFYVWVFKKEKKFSCVPLLILYPRFPLIQHIFTEPGIQSPGDTTLRKQFIPPWWWLHFLFLPSPLLHLSQGSYKSSWTSFLQLGGLWILCHKCLNVRHCSRLGKPKGKIQSLSSNSS